jgi:hypothetical protein
MPQQSRGIQQIQLSLADYEAFPKGGGARNVSSSLQKASSLVGENLLARNRLRGQNREARADD